MINANWPVSVDPQRADHDPGGRVQPRPGGHQRVIGQHVDGVQAIDGVHRTGFGHLE